MLNSEESKFFAGLRGHIGGDKVPSLTFYIEVIHVSHTGLRGHIGGDKFFAQMFLPTKTIASGGSSSEFVHSNLLNLPLGMRMNHVHRHQRRIQVLIFNQNFDFVSTWIGLEGRLYTVGVLCISFSNSFGLGEVGNYKRTCITLGDHENGTSHDTSKRRLEIDLNLSPMHQGDEEQCMEMTFQNTMPPAAENHCVVVKKKLTMQTSSTVGHHQCLLNQQTMNLAEELYIRTLKPPWLEDRDV